MVHAAELHFWRSEAAGELPAGAGVAAEAAFGVIEAGGLLDPIDGPIGVGTALSVLEAPGHTPGHLAVAVGDAFLWTGDALIHPANVTHPEWTSAADMDGERNERTRRGLLTRAAVRGMSVGGCHLPIVVRVAQDPPAFAIVQG
jgi:glyoxylase-like metal-dependent hydrolase (beta-lactamase superfamily II)